MATSTCLSEFESGTVDSRIDNSLSHEYGPNRVDSSISMTRGQVDWSSVSALDLKMSHGEKVFIQCGTLDNGFSTAVAGGDDVGVVRKWSF